MPRSPIIAKEELPVFLQPFEGVFPSRTIAEYLGRPIDDIYNWRKKPRVRPNHNTLTQLGRLASVVEFLQDELSFDNLEVRDYMYHCYIDPHTQNAINMFESTAHGDTALVIQQAIKLSIES